MTNAASNRLAYNLEEIVEMEEMHEIRDIHSLSSGVK